MIKSLAILVGVTAGLGFVTLVAAALSLSLGWGLSAGIWLVAWLLTAGIARLYKVWANRPAAALRQQLSDLEDEAPR